MSNQIVDASLADAMDRKAAAEAKLAAKAAAEDTSRKLQSALDEAALAEAVCEHGDIGDGIAKVSTAKGVVIVKRPTAARWRRAVKDMDTQQKDKLEEVAKTLIVDHLVHPSSDAYFAIIDRYPALPTHLLQMISGLASGGARALSGE